MGVCPLWRWDIQIYMVSLKSNGTRSAVWAVCERSISWLGYFICHDFLPLHICSDAFEARQIVASAPRQWTCWQRHQLPVFPGREHRRTEIISLFTRSCTVFFFTSPVKFHGEDEGHRRRILLAMNRSVAEKGGEMNLTQGRLFEGESI